MRRFRSDVCVRQCRVVKRHEYGPRGLHDVDYMAPAPGAPSPVTYSAPSAVSYAPPPAVTCMGEVITHGAALQ